MLQLLTLFQEVYNIHFGTSHYRLVFRPKKSRTPLSLNDRVLMNHLMTPSLFCRKMEGKFRFTGYITQLFGIFGV